MPAEKCNLCKKGMMIKINSTEIGGTLYNILKCNKCNHEVARSQY